MVDVAKYAENLSPKKQELLKLLLEEKRRKARRAAEEGVSKEAPRTIPRRSRPSPAPVSFAQQRLWFIDQLDPGTPAFNIPAAVRIRGYLDLTVLEQGLAEIGLRHETLRTSFGAEGGMPVQIIAPSAILALPRVDLTALGERRQMAAVQSLITGECQRSFDLNRSPLLRVTLVRLGEDDHVLVVMMHHIIGDVWSVRVLMRELATLCESFATGGTSPLPELPIQYADYAVWQQDELQGETVKRQAEYWRSQLTGMPEELAMPNDHLRPAVQSIWGAKRFLSIDQNVADALRDLGKEESASLFMVLLAAWKAFLARVTGQDDLVIGAPVANRNRSELEGMIGFFVNSLVLRTDLSGDPPFREALRRQREVVLGAFSNQEFPFERLVEMFQPERDMSRNPLFQTDFILQNTPRSAYRVTGLSFESLPVENGTAQLDMTLDLWEEEDGIGGWLEYDIDLFEASTISRIVASYLSLLEEIVADPDRPLSSFSLLSPPQRQQLLCEHNDTGHQFDLDAVFPELFAGSARRVPEAVAVACGDEYLSYRELDRRAGALAGELRQNGIGTDQVVGLLAPRSPDLLTAMLAVFKAGGAYLPMDPDHPGHRHAQVLEQSRACLVLVAADLAPVLSEGVQSLAEIARPRVRTLEESLAGEPAESAFPDGEGSPESLAYAIYTSGSTGTPKGVMIHHRGMLNHLWANIVFLRMTDRDVLAQTASQCFDISVWQFFAPLLLGGRVEIFRDEITRDPIRMLRHVDRRKVTVFETVPSLLRIMLSGQGADAPPPLGALRWLLPTGEALPPELAREWFDRYPAVPMVNAYGPSECSDDVTLELLSQPPEQCRAHASIGRPVANLKSYALDRKLTAVPLGVPAELYVGGLGVGRGYMNRPAQTAAVFVPDPFAAEGGARLYRSGDLGRTLPDGRLEFLGRVDFQVKIRGFRIELGEIEAVLLAHAGVGETVALAREDGAGGSLLVAYVVPAGHEVPAASELRDYLNRRLPEYMVPSALVFLDDMPRSRNGKIDRKALPAPEADRSQEVSYVAPRNPIEEVLAGMWEDILEREQVGVESNLFELGAHSLLVTQVVSRIRTTFEVEPPLRSFFEAPTVAGMARTIEKIQAQAEGLSAPPIVPVDRDGHLPLSYTQERMWFLDQLEPGLTAYNVPGAVHMDGELDFAALEASFAEIVARHEVFRTTYGSSQGKPIQIINPPPRFVLPLVDLSALMSPDRESVALALARANAALPFDLAHDPVLRPVLARLAPDKHLLALTTHHIAYDMWAREIFIFELGVLYEAFAQGKASPLPAPAVQYVDFAHWQRQWLQGEVLEAQLGYWRDKLAGAPEHLELATDLPRPPVQSYRGARQYLELPGSLARDIHALAKAEGVTPFIVVLAAFKILLHRYSGQDHVVVGSPIANRNRVELENLIGFLANTLVLATRVGGSSSFLELLGRVRETALGAYGHQDVPFELLVQELSPERDMSRSPLFQVMFNYMLSYSAPSVDLSQLTLRLERLHSGAAQFEINVDMWETGDGLRGVVEYCTDLFHHTTITRLVKQFRTLLTGAVGMPERRLSDLPLLPPAEHHQILIEGADTVAGYELEASFPELFAAHARETPDAMAAACGGRWLTYGELDQASGAMARRLRAEGVGPDVVVGLLDHRGLPLLTAILGVLRAGGAYLPMDPEHPASRHAQILGQSRTSLVLAAREPMPALEEAARQLPESERPRILPIEAPAAAATEPALTGRPGPENLAYVIFTSGSTGIPKGVTIHHRGMLNHLWANVDFLEMTGRDVLAQTASQCFDISVWQFLAPLLLGGRTHIFEDEVTRHPPRLFRRVERQRVTVFETVPSLIELALSEAGHNAPAFRALRWLLPTGEALPPELGRRWLSTYPDVPLVNAYGPAECSDDVTLHRMTDLPEAGRPAPIGSPVGNLRALLLGRSFEAVPVGVPGEIVVGGVGVGRGYLNEPRRTASAFVPDPFSGDLGGRLYRSGDLGRALADGTLEFRGRIDHQVKVRGFRIELGEIEAVLGRHPALREAVVAVREDDPGHQRLVGYVVAGDDRSPRLEELRGFLAEQLPDYMVPTAFVTLDALPLSANGKVDRKALPAPERRSASETYVAPRNAEEEKVAAIFRDVLKLDQVSIHDDFFDLGGHSLLAIQVLSRIREAFGVEPPLRVVFETSTVAGIAQAVQAVYWVVQSLGSGDDESGTAQEEAWQEEVVL